MSAEQAKNSGPATQDHPYPPPMAPYPQPFGASYPPGYPVYYPPPSDGHHGDTNNGTAPGPQYMIPFAPAPGMMYPYPPPPAGQGYQYPQNGTAGTANNSRPKRKQVKMACTNCANACKRCDEARPCERCMKYGIPDTCVDGVRKERQKGIKRGPYKRKSKPASEPSYGGFTSNNGDAEWQQNGSSHSPTAAPAPPPTMHTLPHFPPPPEGYYPYFYPPPGFMPPGHEGQPGSDGSPNSNGQPPQMLPYYAVPPPGYFPHYPPNGHPYPPPPNGAPAHTIDPGDAHRNSSHSTDTNDPQDIEEIPRPVPSAATKKRARSGKASEPKSKKPKVTAAPPAPTSVGPSAASDRVSEPDANSSGENDGGDV
ncbi:hypothetical protein BJ138DRAFT_1116609 [Hygrophoropsis aurantiaca]|uniref:Uncharacterized protein n=1 Tax=Hygrophoropsis aurantiaca TaxID=72124 RepID=A0ACB8A266_9AGAM|nr:hypothetical protein BJ138DRAFT_1116609 [Hygrophoropsis aurantiaca]